MPAGPLPPPPQHFAGHSCDIRPIAAERQLCARPPGVLLGAEAEHNARPRRFYTIFEPRLDLLQRPADADWQLAEYVADAIRQLPAPARIAFILSSPVPSFAVPQIVFTLQSAPLGARSLPIDLRRVGGLVHTIELLPHCTHLEVWAALHDKGIDLLGHWELAHRAGRLRFIDQTAREINAWNTADERLEWAELQALAAPWHSRVIPYGSTEAQAQDVETGGTTTTTSMGAGGTEVSSPPTLLRARPPAAVCVAPPFDGVQVLPSHLAGPNLSATPAAELCLFDLVAANEDGTRPFTVFLPGLQPLTLQAGAQWSF